MRVLKRHTAMWFSPLVGVFGQCLVCTCDHTSKQPCMGSSTPAAHTDLFACTLLVEGCRLHAHSMLAQKCACSFL